VRPEGLGKLKNSFTSSGLEPATFLLVAQCLNRLRYVLEVDGMVFVRGFPDEKLEADK
jgi:hypothetical protein